MSFLFRIRDICADFLFPKNRKVLELEGLSVGTLLEILPQVEALKDKHTIALFDYSHPLVKELVWELKYRGNNKIAHKLGVILYDVLENEIEELNLSERWVRPILIPVPISDKRRFERGWNQAELLSEQVMASDDKKMFRYRPRQLAKLRHTDSQTQTSSRNERLKNLKNSMKVLNPESVAGECVIVIDDVTTTGSTFAEARRALREAGARKILCVAIAH